MWDSRNWLWEGEVVKKGQEGDGDGYRDERVGRHCHGERVDR